MKKAHLPAILLFAVIACDPKINLYVRESLNPAPTMDCMAAALGASPDVLNYELLPPNAHADGFRATLRDSASKVGHRDAIIIRQPRANNGSLVSIDFAWGGLRAPEAAEEAAASTVAGRVLTTFREACAPGTIPQRECVYSNGRHAQSCN